MKSHNTKTDKINFSATSGALFHTVRGECGAILVMAMLLMIVIVLLVTGVTKMTVGDFTRVTKYEKSRKAFHIAEAGIEKAKYFLKYQDHDDFLLGPDGSASTIADNGLIHDGTGDPGGTLMGTMVTINGNNYSQFNYDNGTYSVRVYDNEDEDPNDPYTDADNIVLIESIGKTDSAVGVGITGYPIQNKIVAANIFGIIPIGVSGDSVQKTVIAAYRKYDLPPGTFPGAITMVGPIANLEAQTATIEIDGGNEGDNGFGWDLKGYNVRTGNPNLRKPDPDPDCLASNAIATEDTGWTYASSDWSTNSEDRFNGLGNPNTLNNGLPDVLVGQTDFTAKDAINMRTELKGYCDNCYTGSHAEGEAGTHNEVINDKTLGTLTDPEITYIDGDATLNNVDGAGILIVDGDLHLVGNVDWAGVILIGACATCWGDLAGAGSAKVYGAMVIGNAIDGESDFNGTANIYYSCAAIGIAYDVFGKTFREVGWYESD